MHNPTNNIASGLGTSRLANIIIGAQKNVGSGSESEKKKNWRTICSMKYMYEKIIKSMPTQRVVKGHGNVRQGQDVNQPIRIWGNSATLEL